MGVHKLTEYNDGLHLSVTKDIANKQSSDMNLLLNSENKKYNTKNMVGFLRHGNTESNSNGDALKAQDEPLSQDELMYLNDDFSGEYKEGTIAYEANQIKNIIGDVDKINIYFPVSIYRCVQTAKIFCKVAGISGFPNDEIISTLKSLYNKGDITSLDEAKKIESTFQSNITIEDGLRTRGKGDISKIEQKNLLGGSTEHGEESSAGSIERSGASIKKILHKMGNNNQKGSYNIIIGHRTGMEAFDVIKQNKSVVALHPESNVGEFKMGYLNSDGKFINQESDRFFEFSFEDYEKQYAELETIKGLKISKENSLIENQNIVNEYLENFKSNLSLEKDTKENKEEKIKKYLYGENKLLQKHTIYYILENIDDEESENKQLLTDWLLNIKKEQKINILELLYNDGGNIWVDLFSYDDLNFLKGKYFNDNKFQEGIKSMFLRLGMSKYQATDVRLIALNFGDIIDFTKEYKRVFIYLIKENKRDVLYELGDGDFRINKKYKTLCAELIKKHENLFKKEFMGMCQDGADKSEFIDYADGDELGETLEETLSIVNGIIRFYEYFGKYFFNFQHELREYEEELSNIVRFFYDYEDPFLYSAASKLEKMLDPQYSNL